MILKVILLLCVVCNVYASTAQNDNAGNVPKLKWSSSYYIEARKYYMSAGLVEDFKYWRSRTNSRLEANDGAVIRININSKLGKGAYEIHPETTETEINKIVCVKNPSSSVRPEELLPRVRGLTQRGTDNVRGIDCVKFTNEGKPKPDVEKTLWAYPMNGTDYWVPVRYKTKEVDEWRGYLLNYELWDFSNFNGSIDVGVFNNTYNCSKRNVKKHKKANRKSKGLLTLNPEETKKLDDSYSRYKRRFGKQFGNKKVRDVKQRSFLKKWRSLSTADRKKLSSKIALKKLADGVSQKTMKYRGLRNDNSANDSTPGNIPFPYSEEQIKKIAENLPKEYDLRVEGHVGPVLDHLSEGCDSAWAFAVTATVEGALSRRNGSEWIKLSEQALIDCSWGHGNKGCEGGSPTNSYQWIMKHGLPLEQHYGKYTNNNGFCKMENMTETFKIKGFTEVPPNNVEALKIALTNHGPVSVNVYQSYDLMTYDTDILYDGMCEYFSYDEIPMTLVGYGERDGDTFWILKDSKGPYRGVDGYIYIFAKDNNCGVMDTPTYAVV